MATNSKLCAGCLRDDEENEADSWCTNCAELVCKPCAKVHRRFSPPHKVVIIEQVTNLSRSILNICRNCEIHIEEKIVMFCCQHDKVICATCVSQSHQNCKPMMSIEKAAKGVRDGTAMADLETRLGNLDLITDGIIEEQKNNLSSLDGQRQQIKKKKKEIRNVIEAHLDKMEEELDRDLQKQYDESKDKIDSRQRDLEKTLSDIAALKKDIQSLKDHASDVHLFQAIKVIDSKTNEKESIVRDMQETYAQVELDFKLTHELTDIPKTVTSFGKVQSNDRKITRPLVQVKDQQGQAMIQGSQKILILDSSFQASKLGKGVEILRGCFISGSKLLLSSATRKCLYACNTDGTHCQVIDLDFMPHRMTVFNGKAFVTHKDKECFSIINLATQETENDILTDMCMASICSLSKTLLVESNVNELSMIDINGKVLKTLKSWHLPWDMCLSSERDIYYINDEILYYIKHDGEESLFYSSPEFDALIGIDVDNNHNVYVADEKTSCVYKIANNGQDCETILSANDMINKPQEISFSHEKNAILVINDEGKSVYIYRLMS